MDHGTYDNEGDDATEWSTFLAGALIGAGIALMFAPQSGATLRGTLRNYANRAKDDLVEKGQEAWDTAVEHGKEYYEKGEAALGDANRSAKEFVKQGKDMGLEAVRSAKEEFRKQGKKGVV
jgi:gas vesicle protein